MKSVFVVATGQNVGKTTLCLGLINLLSSQGYRVGFLKPVGQQYVVQDALKIDKDAVLMQRALSVAGALGDMSPVTVPHGFVEEYIFDPTPEALRKRIIDAYNHLLKECQVLVVEGTGHAGVGACFDLSNAEVAAMLGLQVLIIVEGGIGSALDQFALNLSLFEAKQVKMLGVVANKVYPEKRDRIAKALAQGVANMGHRFLGAIPFDESITYPRVGQIAKEIDAEVLCGEDALERRIEHVLVAAMEPQNVLPRIQAHSLMITPGDRIDNILVALNSKLIPGDNRGRVEGLILTGGLMPHFTIVALMKDSGLPVLLCKENTYEVTAMVQGKIFKILPEDTDKIEQAKRLVKTYVDTEAVLEAVRGG